MNRKRRRARHGEGLSFRPVRVHINRKKLIRELLNWILIVFIAAVTGYAFVTFVCQTITITGPSMGETLSDGDVVAVNKFVYKLHKVERYDVIAYKQVGNDSYYEVKRVVGLPGENIQIRDGRIYVDGEQLTGIYFDEKILTAGVAADGVTLGDGEYFVLGDNVNNSEDSRYTNVGNISSSEIIGRVDYRLTPKKNRGKIK